MLITINRVITTAINPFSASSVQVENQIHTNILTYVMLCAIWLHLYNVKKRGNCAVLLLVCRLKLATVLKVTLLHGCFSRFLNCTNGTKSRRASHINISAVSLMRPSSPFLEFSICLLEIEYFSF